MKPERIVFHIDDDEDDREFFTEALGSENGVRLYSYTSFQQAIAASSAITPDIIYMDFWVPGMPAGQFLRELASRIDLSDTPIHVISGTEVPLFFRELLDRYRVSYHLKPNSPAGLRTLLRTTSGEAV